MRKNLIIADGFYKDPQTVRNFALRAQYYYPYESEEAIKAGQVKASWMSSRFTEARDCPFKSSEQLIRKLEYLTAEKIDLVHWNLGFPTNSEGKPDLSDQAIPKSCLWNCSFHLKIKHGQILGQGIHNHVTDRWNSVGPDGWAGVIYLNLSAPLSGGLHLWRNVDSRRNFDWMTAKENWNLVDSLGNVFNRLILCRGDIPHSGADGWNNDIETGRLFQTFFFRVRSFAHTDGVTIPQLSQETTDARNDDR